MIFSHQDHEYIEESNILFQEGSRVFHKKYGYGKILKFDGKTVNVQFEKSDQKKIFLKYLQFID